VLGLMHIKACSALVVAIVQRDTSTGCGWNDLLPMVCEKALPPDADESASWWLLLDRLADSLVRGCCV